MKKLFCILLIILTLVFFAACGSEKDNAITDNQTSDSSVSQNQTTEKESESVPITSKPAQSADGIDVDLTKLSSTMVYSEVYNMMMNPNDYVGKTVKMRGAFGIGYSYKQDGTIDEDSLVFACVIADATACCSQGIEFVLSGEYNYPDDYPEIGSEITIVGTFATYEKYSMQFCTLTDAVMER